MLKSKKKAPQKKSALDKARSALKKADRVSTARSAAEKLKPVKKK